MIILLFSVKYSSPSRELYFSNFFFDLLLESFFYFYFMVYVGNISFKMTKENFLKDDSTSYQKCWNTYHTIDYCYNFTPIIAWDKVPKSECCHDCKRIIKTIKSSSSFYKMKRGCSRNNDSDKNKTKYYTRIIPNDIGNNFFWSLHASIFFVGKVYLYNYVNLFVLQW